MTAISSLRTGSVAASRVVGGGGTTSLDYYFTSGKPGGMVDVEVTPSTGTTPTVIVDSTTLREGAMTSGSGGYNLHAVMPTDMTIATSISVTVTVGSYSSDANNRAVGPGVFSSDGSSGVYVRFASFSSSCVLYTWDGSSETSRATSSQRATAGDTATLTGTLSSGTWTWTVKKNGGDDIAALTWADSGHVIDLPGSHPGIAFRTQRSGSNFYSRGVTRIVAAST